MTPGYDGAVLSFIGIYIAKYGSGPTRSALVAHMRERVADDVGSAVERLKLAGALHESYQRDLGVRLAIVTHERTAGRFADRPCAACKRLFTPTGPRSLYCRRPGCSSCKAAA